MNKYCAVSSICLALCVGDSREDDVGGAKRAGMEVVWVKPPVEGWSNRDDVDGHPRYLNGKATANRDGTKERRFGNGGGRRASILLVSRLSAPNRQAVVENGRSPSYSVADVCASAPASGSAILSCDRPQDQPVGDVILANEWREHRARHRLARIPFLDVDDDPDGEPRAARQRERPPVPDRRIRAALCGQHVTPVPCWSRRRRGRPRLRHHAIVVR